MRLYKHSRKLHILTCILLNSGFYASISGRGKRYFSPLQYKSVLGPTQLPIQWVKEALSPGVYRPRRDTDHSTLSVAKVKNKRIYTSTPPYVFITECLIEHTDNLTLQASIKYHYIFQTEIWISFMRVITPCRSAETGCFGENIASNFKVEEKGQPAACFRWFLTWPTIRSWRRRR
jgi:hypothetical protein